MPPGEVEDTASRAGIDFTERELVGHAGTTRKKMARRKGMRGEVGRAFLKDAKKGEHKSHRAGSDRQRRLQRLQVRCQGGVGKRRVGKPLRESVGEFYAVPQSILLSISVPLTLLR